MMRAVSVLGLVAVLIVGISAMPQVASTADLGSIGGLPCNTTSTSTPTCAGCTATHQVYTGGANDTILCAEYDGTQCDAPGCTESFNTVQCDGDCG